MFKEKVSSGRKFSKLFFQNKKSEPLAMKIWISFLAVLFLGFKVLNVWSFDFKTAPVGEQKIQNEQSSLSEALKAKQEKQSSPHQKENKNQGEIKEKNLPDKGQVQGQKEKPDQSKQSPLKKNIFQSFGFKNVFQKESSPPCTKSVELSGVIGPASLDTLEHAIRLTKKDNCSSLLVLINTPGGSLLSTRKMVSAILDSPVPVLCLVYPSGAHAGSAGAIVMQACHINGAVQATNMGAATPILGGGKDAPKDLRNKMINDAASWLDSLTDLRKRNKKFGREIVTKARALSAKSAYENKAIDFYGQSIEEFLRFAQGRKVQVRLNKNTEVNTGAVQVISLGVRQKVIQLITDPQMVYLLFMGSLLLIYFEITHPGTVVPGVLGAIGLIVSFIGMHKLNFVWGGLILMLLGVFFMVLEAFVSGFGILGGAGAVSFIVGSFFLFDPSKTGGLDIPTTTILITSAFFISASLGLAYLAYTALRAKTGGEKYWAGKTGVVAEIQTESSGLMEINGETWKYKCSQKLKKGDAVKVVCYKKMVFEVVKA